MVRSLFANAASCVTASDEAADNAQNLLGAASGVLSITILGKGGPAPPLSAVTFLVHVNSGVTSCHVATQTFPVRGSPKHHSVSVLSNFCLAQPILGNAHNCSGLIMMTDKDSLNHATFQRTDTIFSNFTEPNLSLQIGPLAFSIFVHFVAVRLFFPSFPALILFMP